MSDSQKTREAITYLVGIIIIMNLLDAALTLYGLNLGIVQEVNPIIRESLKTPILFYFLKVILPSLVFANIILSVRKEKTEKDLKTIYSGSIFVMLIYVLINTYTMTTIILILRNT